MTSVLHISRGFVDYLDGVFQAIPEECHVNCVMPAADAKKLSPGSNRVTIVELHPPRGRKLGSILFVCKLLSLIARLKPQVIHLQSGVAWELIAVALFPSIPVVLTVHDVDRHPRYGSRKFVPMPLQRFLVWRARCIVVHADAVRETLERKYLTARKRAVFVMPHGPITRYGSVGARREFGARLMFFGGINKYKGLEVLLDAMRGVWRECPNASLTIAGPNPGRLRIEDFVNSSDLSKIKVLDRYIDDSEVAELFCEADLVVLPYIEASQSGVLNLALSFSVPLLVTRVGGLPEIVEKAEFGEVVKPGNSEMLMKAIVRLLRSPKLLEKYSRNIVEKRHMERKAQISTLRMVYLTAKRHAHG